MESRSVLLKNMFDPEEYAYRFRTDLLLTSLYRESGDDWDKELADDVKGECESKYGKVSAIKVEKETQVSIATSRVRQCRSSFTGRNLRQVRRRGCSQKSCPGSQRPLVRRQASVGCVHLGRHHASAPVVSMFGCAVVLPLLNVPMADTTLDAYSFPFFTDLFPRNPVARLQAGSSVGAFVPFLCLPRNNYSHIDRTIKTLAARYFLSLAIPVRTSLWYVLLPRSLGSWMLCVGDFGVPWCIAFH